MSRIKLDLNSFKHIGSDKHSTTLEHKDGHRLTLAHNALSHESKSQLEALRKAERKEGISEQGRDVREGRNDFAKEEAAGRAREERFVRPNMKGLASGGSVESGSPDMDYADGGKVPKSGPNEPKEGKKDKPHGNTLDYKQLKAEKRRMDIDEAARTPPHRRRFDEGGRVPAPRGESTQESKPKGEHEIPSNVEGPSSLDEAWKRVKTEFSLAEGGSIPDDASSAYDRGLPCLNPNCKSHGKPHPNCRCYAHMAEGGSVNLRYCAHGKPHRESCEYYRGGSVPHYAFGTPPPSPIYEDESHPIEEPEPIPSGGVQPTPSKSNYNEELADIEDETNARENDAKQLAGGNAPGADPNFNSVTGQIQPQAQPAPAHAPAPQPQSAPVQPQAEAPKPKAHESLSIPQPGQTQEEHADDVEKNLNDRALQVATDYGNGSIKPMTYNDLMYKDKSVPAKIGNIFGLLLSGAGSGLAHQQNMALQMMDKIIDNDISAQKSSKESQLNFLNKFREYEKTKSDIALQGQEKKLVGQQTEGARINNEILALTQKKTAMMLDILNDLYGKGQNLPPDKQPQYMQAVGTVANGVHQKILQDNKQAAQAVSRNAVPYNSEQQYDDTTQKLRAAGMLGMEGADKMADTREAHLLPGVGYTSKAVDGATQDRFTKIANFQNLLREAQDLSNAQKYGGWTPAQKARAAGIQNDLTVSYNDVKGLNRFTKNEEDLYKGIVPNMSGKWDAVNGARGASLDRLIKSVKQRNDLEFKHAGIVPFDKEQSKPPSQQQPQSQFQEGQTATNPKTGQRMINKGGQWVPIGK